MPIHTSTAPRQSMEAVQQVLQGWMNQPGLAPMATHAGIDFAVQGGVRVSLPHPVYEVTLNDVAAGKGLDMARQVSWRYLVSDGTLTSSAETVTVPGEEAQHEFSMMNRGPLVEQLIKTVAAAERDPAIANENYEVSVLQIPGIYLTALWLRPSVVGQEILIPLQPAPAGLSAGQKYNAADMLKAIRPAVQEVLKRSGDPLSS